MPEPVTRTLLLVEDEFILAQAERLALQDYGYAVVVAGTGERAIEIVRQDRRIDLILMDIDLGPGIDGTESAERILQDRDLPIVFLSSHTEPGIVEKTERITSYGYVVKDSNYVVLNASIRMAFRLYEANHALRLSHETYKGMINSVTEAIYVQDEKGVFLDINDRCVDFYGIPREQVIGRTPEFLAAPGMNDLTQIPALHARAFGGEPQTIEFWGRKMDGTPFPKEVTLSPGMYFGQKVVIAVARDVTVRRLTNERLREREAYLKAILENSLGSIWAIDREYRILYVNEVFAREYFASFHIHLRVGEDIVASLPDPLRELWRQRYERVITRNERFTFVDQVPTATGVVHIEVAMTPIVVDGQAVGASMYGSNITDRVTAGERTGYENRMRELLIGLSTNFINQPVSALRATIQNSLAQLGGFVGADRVYVIQYDRATRTGSNTFEWCKAGVASQIGLLQDVPFDRVDPWVQALDRGESVHVASTGDLPAGSQREFLEAQDIKSMLNIPLMTGSACIGLVGFDSVETHHTYSLDEQQLLRVYASMLVNVLERQDAEKDLRQSTENFQRLYSLLRRMSDTMPDMLWAKDLDNRYIFANKAICTNLLNAVDTSEPIGKTDMYFAHRERERHPDDPAWHTFGELCIDSDAVTLREMKEMQFDEYGNVQGSFLYLDVHKAPLLNDAGELIGVVGSARDITARKQAEQRIEQKLAENELLIREVHHRISNNITSIASLLTMQARDVTDPAALAILQDAIARVATMRVLHEKLLKSTDHVAAAVKPFVEGLVSATTALFTDDRRIRITTRIDEFDLGSKKLFPLGIIITELLTNALKYAFVGRDAGAIEITITRVTDLITLTLADDGIGLPETLTAPESGGFGLFLVRVLSEQLDGTYSVESRGKGTRNELTFRH